MARKSRSKSRRTYKAPKRRKRAAPARSRKRAAVSRRKRARRNPKGIFGQPAVQYGIAATLGAGVATALDSRPDLRVMADPAKSRARRRRYHVPRCKLFAKGQEQELRIRRWSRNAPADRRGPIDRHGQQTPPREKRQRQRVQHEHEFRGLHRGAPLRDSTPQGVQAFCQAVRRHGFHLPYDVRLAGALE